MASISWWLFAVWSLAAPMLQQRFGNMGKHLGKLQVDKLDTCDTVYHWYTWGSYRWLQILHNCAIAHLKTLPPYIFEKNVFHYNIVTACSCSCMQLKETQRNSLLNFFLQEKPEHGHDDGHSLWLKSFWYLIFPRFALTSKGHVSLASEYKCLHHSHPFCMFFLNY